MDALRNKMKISIPEIDNVAESKQKELIDYDYTSPVVSEEPWEMKILELLVSSQIHEFISPNWNDTFSSGVSSKRMQSQRKLSAFSSSNLDTSSTSKRKSIDSQSSGEVTNTGTPPSNNPWSRADSGDIKRNNFMDPIDSAGTKGPHGIGAGISSRQRRRDLILECRKLRNEISKFEEDFTATNHREPKPSERGKMHAVYIRYRNLKRTVRDEAATDIQRAFRGMVIRSKVRLSSKSSKSRLDSVKDRRDSKSSPSSSDYHDKSSSLKKSHLHALQSSPNSETQRSKLIKKHGGDSGGGDLTTDQVLPRSVSLDSSEFNHKAMPPGSPAVSTAGNHVLISSSDLEMSMSGSQQQQQQRKRKGVEITRSLAQPQGQSGDTFTDWLTASPRGTEMRNKYLELHQQKHHLKSVLKRFDEDFSLLHGRMPMRKEKETMRTTYEQYHDLKASISKLKSEIEIACGQPLTDDQLLNDGTPRETNKRAGGALHKLSPAAGSHSVSSTISLSGSVSTTSTAAAADATNGRSRTSSFESASLFEDEKGQQALRLSDVDENFDLGFQEKVSISSSGGSSTAAGAKSDSTRSSSSSSSSSRKDDKDCRMEVKSENMNSDRVISLEDIRNESKSNSSPSSSAVSGLLTRITNSVSSSSQSQGQNQLPAAERTQLATEKKLLLVKLKGYEKDFVRTHHRPVTRVDDIAPVAAEYKRYKELKSLLNESS